MYQVLQPMVIKQLLPSAWPALEATEMQNKWPCVNLVSEIFRHVTGHHSSVRNQNFGRPGHRSHCIRTAQNGTVHPYLYGYGEQPYYKLKPFQSSLKITNSYGLGNNSENKREVQKKKKFKNSKTNKFWKEFGKSQNVQPFAYVRENWTKIF